MNSLQRDQKYILNTYKRLPLEISKIRGNTIYDIDGNAYLDFFSGIAVNNFGYDEEIVNALKEKMNSYLHISNYFVDADRTALAQLLVEHTIDGKVFFSNSGTETTEAALKLVKKWGRENGKTTILTAQNSFHGRTTGALALTGQPKYQKAFEPLLPGITHFIYNDVMELRRKVNEETSAIFLEVVQGEGGVIPITEDFAAELNALRRQYGFLIVVDEIQTGLGRCNQICAYQNYQLQPDLILLAKSLGGGLPLGALIVAEHLTGVLQAGDHGSTFGGNPVACAGGRAILEKLTNPAFIDRQAEKATYFRNALESLQDRSSHVIRSVRGIGFMMGLDAGAYAPNIRDEAMKLGLLLNVTSGTILRLIPPLTITEKEIDYFAETVESICENL